MVRQAFQPCHACLPMMSILTEHPANASGWGPTWVCVPQQLAWRMNNRVFAARNYALRHLIDTWVEEYLPGKDPRTPLGQDCRDAVVLFGPSQPQAAALPAANRSHLPRPEADSDLPASAVPTAQVPGPAAAGTTAATGPTADQLAAFVRRSARMRGLGNNPGQP